MVKTVYISIENMLIVLGSVAGMGMPALRELLDQQFNAWAEFHCQTNTVTGDGIGQWQISFQSEDGLVKFMLIHGDMVCQKSN